MTSPRRSPARLTEPVRDPVGALLAVARDLEPSAAARERIWKALEGTYATTPSPLLEAARQAVEPPPGALERIWRRLLEEARVRAGLAEPVRLADAEDGPLAGLLASARELEPGYAVDVRVRRRVEAAVASPRRPFAWLKWVVAPVAVAAATAWFVVTQAPMPVAPAPETVAAAPVTPPAPVAPTLPTPAPAPSRLAIGTVVTGGSNQRTSLAGVGDLVLAGRAPRLDVVRDDDAGTRLRLASGRLVLRAEKRAPGRPLAIEAGDVQVVVVGTVFAVEHTGARVQVLVAEGTVAVRRPGLAPLFVRAGERWSSTGTTDKAPWMAREAALVTAGTSIALRTAFTPVRVSAPARPLDGPVEAVSAAPSIAPAAVATVVAPLPPAAPAAAAAPPDAFDLAALARPFAGLDVGTLEAAVVDAHRAARHQAEAGLLFQLSRHPAASARARLDALEALAALADGALGEPAAAIELRRDIARRSKTNRAGALFELTFALHELGRTDEALDAATQCLAACEPARLRAVKALRARLLQDAGRLDAARVAYRELPADALAAGAEVLALRARFHADRGQLDRARRAAQSSLALDPAGPHARDARLVLAP